MEEYKGLKVPITLIKNGTAKERQNTYCDKSRCGDLDCRKCLFNSDNLNQFIEWEKENNDN